MDSIHAGSRPGLHNEQRVGESNFHNGIEEEQCFLVSGEPMVDTTIDMTESMPVASRGQGGRSGRPASFRLLGWTDEDAGTNFLNGIEEEMRRTRAVDEPTARMRGANFLTVTETRGRRPGGHGTFRAGVPWLSLEGLRVYCMAPAPRKTGIDTTIDMTESMPVASRGQGGRSGRPASFRLSGWTKGDAGKNSHNGNEEEGKNFLTVVEKRGLRLSGAVMV